MHVIRFSEGLALRCFHLAAREVALITDDEHHCLIATSLIHEVQPF